MKEGREREREREREKREAGNQPATMKQNKKKIKKTENDVIITEFINKATGLTQENVDKLFDRFYTVDNSRSDRNTGLGLYITKILVEKLGHNIKANLKEDNLVISITWKKN